MRGRRLLSNSMEKVKAPEDDVKPENGVFEAKPSSPFSGFAFNQTERSLKHMPVLSKKYFSASSSVRFRTLYHRHSVRETRILQFMITQNDIFIMPVFHKKAAGDSSKPDKTKLLIQSQCISV